MTAMCEQRPELTGNTCLSGYLRKLVSMQIQVQLQHLLRSIHYFFWAVVDMVCALISHCKHVRSNQI